MNIWPVIESLLIVHLSYKHKQLTYLSFEHMDIFILLHNSKIENAQTFLFWHRRVIDA